MEQKLDFAFPIVRRPFKLGELVSPQYGLKCENVITFKTKKNTIRKKTVQLPPRVRIHVDLVKNEACQQISQIAVTVSYKPVIFATGKFNKPERLHLK